MIQITDLFLDLTLDIGIGKDIRFHIKTSYLNFLKIRSSKNNHYLNNPLRSAFSKNPDSCVIVLPRV